MAIEYSEIEELTTDQQATFRTEIGAASAAGLSTETATRASADAALQTAINNLSGSSGVPYDYSAINPTVGSDINYRRAIDWVITVDSSTLNVEFATFAGHVTQMQVENGDNDIDQQNKSTFTTQSVNMLAYGMGQRVLRAEQLASFAEGDAIMYDRLLYLASGLNASGDEGQKIGRDYIVQYPYIPRATIASVAKSAVSTTLSQSVTASKDPQTVTVVDATGVSVNDWVCFDAGLPSSEAEADCEAVFVTAVNGNQITGVFRHDHNSGALVRGATVLTFTGGTQFGQGRYAVNLSATPYTTGTARVPLTGDNRITVNGNGTNWSNAMVGGDSLNIGAITFDIDAIANYDGSTPLRVFYPVQSVTNGTQLLIHRKSQVGGGVYQANAISDSTWFNYSIYPAARILRRTGNAGVVLTPNSFAWSVGHVVECPHSHNMDINGFTERASMHSPGMYYGTWREISNTGTQDWDAGMVIGSYGGIFGGNFLVGLSLEASETCLYLTTVETSSGKSIQINTAGGRDGSINWSFGGEKLFYNHTNRGLSAVVTDRGYLASCDFVSPDDHTGYAKMNFTGAYVSKHAGANEPSYWFERSNGDKFYIEADATGLLLKKLSSGGSTTTLGRIQVA